MNKKIIFVCAAFILVVGGTLLVLHLYDSKQDTQLTDVNTQPDAPREEARIDDSNQEPLDHDFDQTLVVVFHNNAGPMCLDAITFFQENDIEYEEHLTSDEDFVDLLSESQAKYNGESEGVSTTFGYYPITFVGNRAFSGFDDTIKNEIRLELDEG